jgi:hypothetical protein
MAGLKAGGRRKGGSEGRLLFLKKRSKKTFILRVCAVENVHAPVKKSFLLLLYKKEA